MDEEDEALSQILSELEAHHLAGSSDRRPPLSDASLSALQSLFDGGDGSGLWDALSSRNLPPASLVDSLSAAMDSGGAPNHSLVASRTYLTVLLSPSSPVYTLFNPVTFFALLSSLRRALKPQQPAEGSGGSPPQASASASQERGGPKRGRKRKGQGFRADGYSGEGTGDLGKMVMQVLDLLDSVLGRVRLDSSPDGVKSLVECVVGILESGMGQNSRVSELCFRILYGIVSRPEHGDQMTLTVEVMKALTPVILSWSKSALRAVAIGFVLRRLMPMSKEIETVRKALVYLPRYLSTKAPEKTEPRANAVESILEVVKAMDPEEHIGFAMYVVKMSRGKPHLRLLAVDLILALLTSLPNPLEAENFGNGGDDEADGPWGLKCLEALLQRCSDAAAGIRARALTNIGQVIEFLSVNRGNHSPLRKVMALGSFSDVLRKRCVDEKAAVRKAALLLISRATALIGGPIDEVLLKTVGSACSDPLVSIRKAALSAISEVFRKFLDAKVITEWLYAVPRLITDNETGIQEECENLFLELILDWISKAGNGNLTSNTKNLDLVLPNGLLVLMEGMCDGEVTLFVKKICTGLGKKKKLKASVATSLQNIITASESMWLNNSMPIQMWTAPPGAWMLLSEVSLFLPKAVGWKFLRHHWELLDKSVSTETNKGTNVTELNSVSWANDRVSLLQIISNVSLELPPEPAAELAHNLLQRIEGFNMHLTEVDAHVKALRTLCKRKAAKPEEGDTLVSKWVNQILSKALKILESCITESSEANNSSSYLTPKTGKGKGKKEALESESVSQAVTAVFTIGSLILVCPGADMKNVIPLLHSVIASGISQGNSKRLAGLTLSIKDKAPSLYNQAWVTMGKICLVDDKLAKRYIPLFVQELDKNNSAALRNNILLVMADFCVRHTALVDCYIPKITNLLRDPCEIVRRQAFILLSRLLQRDYVKWRGVLFLRFLLPLVDESKKIRDLADFLFGNFLKVKAPLLAYNSFVEAIFVLNDCHAHAGHSDTSKTGTQLFSIRGNDEKPRSQRMHIYISLLKQMAPEQLLATSAKLCAEILAAASDGLLNLDDITAQSVLQDALQILACKEMRIQLPRGSDTADIEEDGGDGGALLAARGRAVTQVSKKNLIQHAIPIFIELKRLLESKNSPLTGCLMECLRVLLKDYKNEIEDILIADKQLQKELMYDMQKYEAAKAKSTVTEAVSTMQREEGFLSPTNRGNNSNVYAKVSEKLGTSSKITSAVADAAAKATARSVLKELNRNIPTPLHCMSVPKVRPPTGGFSGDASRRDRPSAVLESVRRRQNFDSDDDN